MGNGRLYCGLLAAGAGLMALACAQEGPQAQVQKAFDASVEGVRKGDAAAVVARLSPRFEGPEGMDRGSISFYLMGLFKQEKVGVTVLAQHIELQGPLAASQTVDLILTGRTGGSLLPDDTSRKTYVLRWERRDGEWLLRELREVSATPER